MFATATPEQVGLSSSRLAQLHAELQSLVDEGQLAGIATLIARRGQVVDSRCYGLLDTAAKKALRPDSLFRLAWLTKPITSVAALMLFDEGCFDLDEPVSRSGSRASRTCGCCRAAPARRWSWANWAISKRHHLPAPADAHGRAGLWHWAHAVRSAVRAA